MMLRKIALFAIIALVFGCKGDNDDIIEPDDIINIDLDEGIVFGTINPSESGENLVYLYTNDGVFPVSDSPTITTDDTTDETIVTWDSTAACPFIEGSLTFEFSEGIKNVARGIRDIPSTDYDETVSEGLPFYVLEYVTSGNRKSIQVTNENSFNEEQINTYFSDMKTALILLADVSSTEASPTSCDIEEEEEEVIN